MKRFRFAAVLAGACLTGAVGMQGAITCTTADFNGSYAFYTTGALLVLPPAGAALVGPFSQYGTFNSDGQGNVNIDSVAGYNGLILNGSAPGTYTITPDCVITFQLILPFPLSLPATFTAVLASGNRQEVVMITDPPGTVVVGRHLKQDMRFCGTLDFNGAFQVDLSGTVLAPKERAGMFQRIGRLVTDGNGAFTAKTLANYAGRIVAEDFGGTYEVNSKCYVTFKYSFGGEQQTISGAIGGHGEAAMMMVATPGWSVGGTLKAQQ